MVDSNAKAGLTYKVGYKGNKRYLRVIDRRTGTQANGTPSSVLALLGKNRYSPIA